MKTGSGTGADADSPLENSFPCGACYKASCPYCCELPHVKAFGMDPTPKSEGGVENEKFPSGVGGACGAASASGGGGVSSGCAGGGRDDPTCDPSTRIRKI